MVAMTHVDAATASDRSTTARWVMVALSVALVAISIASLFVGATGLSPLGVIGDLVAGRPVDLRAQVVIFDIRLPRLSLGLLVGAALAVSGVVMQGLFRNPLADPGLVGVSAGAGLGAILAIVLGGLLPPAVGTAMGYSLVPIAAFVGGWLSVIALYSISTRGGHTSVATMLLAGIALAALVSALSGIMIYLADDAQLRTLTFWGLGSLAGATWSKVLAAAPLMLVGIFGAPLLARGLNGLALGEPAARHMGIDVQILKRFAILLVSAAVGAAVAVSGGIGFVGIVVPHLLRLSTGPDHRYLLINAALLGAIILILADMVARVIVAPAELPIGIVMAIIGGPFFLWILLRRRGLLEM
ncbi:FecCD family ABC transporter permease [Maritimibacter dapengensis]|uniref:Iron ABC transporter permease n=1 Tax=Maritimibacter dapengensis TaxID=2836868 RepID=A0ABS6SYF9_9RHOB|nr:iron ABC transporter permease [Maritimibacter dapengensis]MBV7378008.1 iron ABC transporter permease [Maritimibacter dapengensis]